MNDSGEGCGSRQAIGVLQSVATIASQLFADIRHIYQGEYDSAESVNSSSTSPGLQECLEMTYQGTVLLVATRRNELRESFCLELAEHFSLRQDHAVSFYGMTKPGLNFVRDLASHMANIPSDTAIYDGRLNDDELKVLYAVLDELSKAQIYITQGEYLELDFLCEAITKHEEQYSGAGLVIVDNAQQIYCNACTTDTLSNMHLLKQLSETINAPVIALFRLDTGERQGDFRLTRHELALMEKLSIETSEILMMGGAPGRLLFQLPKVAKRGIAK